MDKYQKEDYREALLNEIKRIASKLGKTPTIVEYKRISDSNFAYDRVVGQFGSWNNAIIQASLEPNPTKEPPSNKISEESLITEYIKIANELGYLPPRLEFTAKSKYSRGPYERRFGTWSKFMQLGPVVKKTRKVFNNIPICVYVLI